MWTSNVYIGRSQHHSKNRLKYLGVTLDQGLTFGKHIEEVTKEAERTTAALARLLPNIGGTSSSKRRTLCSVANSIILYAAPIWRKALNVKRHRDKLIRVQRKAAIRICGAYRTISTEAVLVIAGTMPIKYLTEESIFIHDRGEPDGIANGNEARKRSVEKWQERWSGPGKGAWTRRTITNIKKWIERGHGEVNYALTQFLSGHGCINAYLNKIDKAPTMNATIAGKPQTLQSTRRCTAPNGKRTD